MTGLDVSLDEIVALVPGHLVQQRWYEHDTAPEVVVADAERWIEGDPSLWWLLVDVRDGDRDLGRYQLYVGARTAPETHDFLHGKDHELLGGVTVETDDGSVAVTLYDATIDAPLAIEILGRIAPGTQAHLVRPLTVEQSNSSIVYDEHVIVKLFRRIHHGTNPDVDAIARLLEQGYEHVPGQQGVLRRDDQDLAVARTFLTGATDGWHLALTSLRIMLASHDEDASASGGDFGPDARRLGTVTADLHLRLAIAYGTDVADLGTWVAGFRSQLDRVRDHVPALDISARYDQVAQLGDPGPALRIHGDLHLGQMLRADPGWFVIDFEGEPARPLAERLRPSSPLRDVAGMLRSFHYAAEVARWERGIDDEESHDIVRAWEEHARQQFLAGYFGTRGIDDVLPDDATTEALLRAFELDKAVYEVAYEIGFRPTWVSIPLDAIERLLT